MSDGTCIYCKRHGSLTREHVMPRALGGNVKPYLVCERCRFSELDQALAENTLLSMARVGFTSPKAFPAQLGGMTFKYDEKHDLHLEIALRNGMTAVPLPQIHFRLKGELIEATIFAESEETKAALVALIDSRLKRGGLELLHVKLGPADVCTTARIVMHRSDDAFMRAATQEEAAMFLERLAVRWGEGVRTAIESSQLSSTVVEKPKVNIRLSICPDDEYRAVAKIAFNVMAMDFGAEFALKSEFDPIRDYISGRDIRHPEPRAPDEVAVDHRFVESGEVIGESFVPSQGHTVTIFNRGPALLAWVTLYRSHDYLVRLGDIAGPRLDPWCREFSIHRDGSEVLDVMEIHRRRVERQQQPQVASRE